LFEILRVLVDRSGRFRHRRRPSAAHQREEMRGPPSVPWLQQPPRNQLPRPRRIRANLVVERLRCARFARTPDAISPPEGCDRRLRTAARRHASNAVLGAISRRSAGTACRSADAAPTA
jgi:hypothetical protein